MVGELGDDEYMRVMDLVWVIKYLSFKHIQIFESKAICSIHK